MSEVLRSGTLRPIQIVGLGECFCARRQRAGNEGPNLRISQFA